MKSKVGEIILVLGVLLSVFGAVVVLTNSLPQNTLLAMGFFVLFFVGLGISLKKQAKK